MGSGQTRWPPRFGLLSNSVPPAYDVLSLSIPGFAPCGQVLQCSAYARCSWAALRLLNRSKIPLQKTSADCNCLCIKVNYFVQTLFWASCQPIPLFRDSSKFLLILLSPNQEDNGHELSKLFEADPFLSNMNRFHKLTSCFFKIHLTIVFPSMPGPPNINDVPKFFNKRLRNILCFGYSWSNTKILVNKEKIRGRATIGHYNDLVECGGNRNLE
jgi:hypothetical protein